MLKGDDARVFRPLREKGAPDVLYKEIPADFTLTGLEFVEDVRDADYVAGTQSIRRINPATMKYIDSVKRLAGAAGKPALFFAGSDLADRVHIDGAVLFTPAVYGRTKTSNEILFAPFVEDLGIRGVSMRLKRERPTVAFCGYAGFPTLTTRIKYVVKNALTDVHAIVASEPRIRARKRGIYFRRKSLAALERDTRIDTRFIVRDSFSGNVQTASIDPHDARRAYIENMTNTDFALCPKGDGNYSSRFYEALSLGRIPIVIDTDIVLPLEATIPYADFVVRVPFGDVKHVGDYVMDFWSRRTNAQFEDAQRLARGMFRRYLRYDAFFNYAFPTLVERGPEALS